MAPCLTIAIPTLNRASLVGRAIESALAQTSPDVEILVSDNGSTDDTQSVIARYAGRGLRTFRHPKTISVSQHGHFLFQQARGEFFLGLSDDDYLEPEFAAEVLAHLSRHPELSFVYTGCAVHYQNIEVPALVGPSVESGLDFLAAYYAGKRELSWCAIVTRVRDLLEFAPEPEDRVLGDMYFWTKFAFRGPVGCVPRVLSHYILLRSFNDNISHGTSPLNWAREQRLLADEVLEASRQSGASAEHLASLSAATREYVARTASNQFVWTRVRGAGLKQAWQWLPTCLPYLSWKPAMLARLGAALTLPRGVLRYLLLRGASHFAAMRSSS
jgi:glycosyltransferase involved in cell wall biosynthesis